MVAHTEEELRRLQSLPLELKIERSLMRIREFQAHFNGKTYVSFSGGKDSTVLLHLVRSIFPKVPAVFCDTGLEFPEVKEHVKTFDNVITVKPKITFREVIKEHGWVFPSKEVATVILAARQGSQWALNQLDGKDAKGNPKQFLKDRFAKYKYLLDAPFKISPKCCEILKEKPIAEWEKKYKLRPYLGLMAEESHRRKRVWMQSGCNTFSAVNPSSKPLSFWTEQDILQYITEYNISIPKCYGNIVFRNGKYKTTQENRTGCMYCIIGSHLETPNQFQRLAQSHPNVYKYCMNQLGLDEVLNWLGIEHGDTNEYSLLG